MTGEHYPTPDKESEELFARLRGEIIDPVAQEMLDNMLGVRDWMNASSTAQVLEIGNVIADLNTQSYQNELYGNTIIVTGKLRPNFEDDDDDDYASEAQRSAEMLGLGELQQDERGVYYFVVQRPVTCGAIKASFESSASHTVSGTVELNVGLDVDEDLDETKFVMNVEDIEMLNTNDPSAAMIERRLQANFPDVYAQLQTLPESVEDATAAHALIEDFVLDIDWSNYPHESEESLGDLPWMIDEYITNRLKFDAGWYEYTVKGLIMGFQHTADGPRTLFREVTTPTTITATPGYVKLLEVAAEPNAPESVSRYLLKYTMLSRKRGGGNQYIEIPANSVIEFKDLSNDLFFEGGTLLAEDDSDEPIIELANNYFGGAENAEYNDNEDDQTDPEVDGDDTEEVMTPDEYLEMRRSYYEEIEHAFELFFAKCDAFRHTFYDSVDDALDDLKAVSEYAQNEISQYVGIGLRFTVSGPDLRSMPAKISSDVTTGSIQLSIEAQEVREGDTFSVETGKLVACEIGLEKAEDDRGNEKVKIAVQMVLANPDAVETATINEPGTGRNYIDVALVRHFRMHVSANSEFVMVDSQWLKDVSERIDSFSVKYPEYEDVPGRMSEFLMVMDHLGKLPNATDIDVSDIAELLNRVADNPAATKDALLVLSETLTKSMVHLDASYYEEDGTPRTHQSISGVIADIFIPESGPAVGAHTLLVRSDEKMLRIPLESIRRFRY